MSLWSRQYEDPLLVSQREAARLLSVSERTLFAMRARGEIGFVKCGARVLYAVEDLRTWIIANKERV